ncbi:hypothetical protein CRE_05456 [Caenorhabditis remanei]|uniref:Uncharacterized protein n=1 Tax=Caenorhabditis remanei TaxID=31234 RepID=E3M0M1_CAERE|nr:hypothetical protein CRE_05456 [Caenorhabditis remanei]
MNRLNEEQIIHSEMMRLLEKILSLAGEMKNFELQNQKATVIWASEWVEKVDNLNDAIENLADRIMIAESFKQVSNQILDWNLFSIINIFLSKISSSHSEPLKNKLTEIVIVMSKITENMYKIINRNQDERLNAAKIIAEQRINILLIEKERITRLLEAQKLKIKQKEELERQKSEEVRSTEMRREMRIKALEEHKKYLASRQAIEFLNSVNDATVISSHSNEDTNTIIEDEGLHCRKKRRSRSLARKVVGSVKKTIRRSISAVNNYLPHLHHHDKQE